MLKIVLFIWSAGFCVCEQPTWNFYTNSPIISGQYGAPPLPSSLVQISKENVEFVEQTVEIDTPRNQYQLRQSKTPPPASLPKTDPPKPFRNSFETKAKFSQPNRLFNHKLSKQTLPSKYGPPTNLYPYPPSMSPPVNEVVFETAIINEDGDEEIIDPAVIAVANGRGRYYILGKDNTLQRVVYETLRTKDDNIHNGFTAHLHYSPVEPIRDPIYGYDEEGHLVRLYNRK